MKNCFLATMLMASLLIPPIAMANEPTFDKTQQASSVELTKAEDEFMLAVEKNSFCGKIEKRRYYASAHIPKKSAGKKTW